MQTNLVPGFSFTANLAYLMYVVTVCLHVTEDIRGAIFMIHHLKSVTKISLILKDASQMACSQVGGAGLICSEEGFLVFCFYWANTKLTNPKDVHESCELVRSLTAAHIRKPTCQSHLVISFTEELESLSSLVHEDAVQVTGLHRADLDGLLAPTHDLVRPNVGCEKML